MITRSETTSQLNLEPQQLLANSNRLVIQASNLVMETYLGTLGPSFQLVSHCHYARVNGPGAGGRYYCDQCSQVDYTFGTSGSGNIYQALTSPAKLEETYLIISSWLESNPASVCDRILLTRSIRIVQDEWLAQVISLRKGYSQQWNRWAQEIITSS